MRNEEGEEELLYYQKLPSKLESISRVAVTNTSDSVCQNIRNGELFIYINVFLIFGCDMCKLLHAKIPNIFCLFKIQPSFVIFLCLRKQKVHNAAHIVLFIVSDTKLEINLVHMRTV